MTDSENDRLASRHPVLLQARCRKTRWHVFPVELGDISQGGCSILGSRESFMPGEEVQLRIANFKPIVAHVRWVDGNVAGVEFRSALSKALIEELGRTYAMPTGL
ncbi:PilZ domain-containing protein [Novosphingobium guangzhouense]|uniref:Pilus assembly protein PilZ n=1 Tax=Novosphingobium guangzhouense TaxID=1850347 RepID=A0A2K2G557_9SPHN|nr:PilZ domain-containing protein [Novosphingobium guangzhouense]PNU06152.1 pilus assembly protein PilZ [Novosphingobium guangzhouense]